MSWPAVAWALAQRTPSSASKFLLTVIADAASVGDWLAWPSVAYLSEITQQDRKTVLKNLKALEEAKLIMSSGKAGKTGQVTVWKLPVPTPTKSPKTGTGKRQTKSPKTGTASNDETVPNFPGNSTTFPPKQSQIWDTEPIRNQLGTRESARDARAPAPERGSRLPDNWQPSTSDMEFCQKRRPDLIPSEVADRFRDYWAAQPGAKGRKANWSATWRNWVRNERPVQAALSKPHLTAKPWEGAH